MIIIRNKIIFPYLLYFLRLHRQPLSCPFSELLILNSAFSSRTSALLLLTLLSFFFGSLPSMSSSLPCITLGMRFTLAPTLVEKRGKRRKENCISRAALSFLALCVCGNICVCLKPNRSEAYNNNNNRDGRKPKLLEGKDEGKKNKNKKKEKKKSKQRLTSRM